MRKSNHKLQLVSGQETTVTKIPNSSNDHKKLLKLTAYNPEAAIQPPSGRHGLLSDYLLSTSCVPSPENGVFLKLQLKSIPSLRSQRVLRAAFREKIAVHLAEVISVWLAFKR